MATQHHRTSPHSKKALPRSSRPQLNKRTPSHTNSKSGHKAAVAQGRDDDEELMATGFLQFCTTCEKQIIVPNNSLLYCSDSCRKKDQAKQPVFNRPEPTPPHTPFGTFTFDDLPIPNIVPPRSPTTIASHRSSIALSEIASDDDTANFGDEMRPRPAPRSDSEAARYLRQFHASDADGQTNSGRPSYHRSTSSTNSATATPSLSHTPASYASTSVPYTPSTRPLPHYRSPYSSSCGCRSTDLVTPFAHTESGTLTYSLNSYALKSAPSLQSTIGTAEGETFYEKKLTTCLSPRESSLKQLFNFEAMQRPPTALALTKPHY